MALVEAPHFDLADRLTKARHMAGLDQQELAEKADISVRSVSNYERRLTRPRRPQLLAWAEATGVSVDWLEGGTVTPCPSCGELAHLDLPASAWQQTAQSRCSCMNCQVRALPDPFHQSYDVPLPFALAS